MKPGDLCYIVNCAAYTGLFCTFIRIHNQWDVPEDVAEIDLQNPRMVKRFAHNADGTNMELTTRCYIELSKLRKVLGPEGTDETLQWTPVPTEVTA